ncbi:MAG: TRAP transporter small permease subunit [Rhodospirillaceae bacterium]|jgi:TRAP-type mannitol/chloroaromatic compound transport system permease small subunit|nr:TRAP transporter small permease subunit [Rhodospirillaceae bacterium]MBT6206333.1 TRAP transporter small permease subunit [Rhodospirillaceae bacterium]MBT6511508.1 TRAP transporter small permease subunit [Rhodospirillaceae bacterium]MBT7615298.1 TRAP transporter small permease subunit [Rhodospirillaceae bacterium]
MIRSLYAIDRLSTWVGKAFAWCILVLTFATVYEVVSRYVFNHPTAWAFDMSVQMYGALFMMAGAYTLSRNGHVRGDVIHRLLPTKWQAGVDLFLYIIFFFPGAIALVWYGADYAADSWGYRKYSWNSPAQIQIYFFKTLIPVAGAILFLQGISEVVRCVRCIRTGVWPERMAHVEETEIMLMNEAQDLHAIGQDDAANTLETRETQS